jgi:hypothetical protein
MRIITKYGIALMLFVFFFQKISVAQNQQDSKAAPANRELAKKSRAELASVNENHQLLSALVGTWSFTGRHFSPDPNIKQIEFKGSVEIKELWGGRYFITETTGEDIPMPWSNGKLVTVKDMSIDGYDNTKQKFVKAVIGNEFETGIIMMEGSYDSATRTITYEVETASHQHKDMEPGTVMEFRYLVKLADKDHFVIENQEFIAGKKIHTTELKYTRINRK